MGQIDKPHYSEQINVINTYWDPRSVCYSSGKLPICTNNPYISTFVLNNPSLQIKCSMFVYVLINFNIAEAFTSQRT